MLPHVQQVVFDFFDFASVELLFVGFQGVLGWKQHKVELEFDELFEILLPGLLR